MSPDKRAILAFECHNYIALGSGTTRLAKMKKAIFGFCSFRMPTVIPSTTTLTEATDFADILREAIMISIRSPDFTARQRGALLTCYLGQENRQSRARPHA
jgi:hypothetical protein